MCVFSHVWLFATLQTVAHQTLLSMEFPRQEYWSRLPFPSPRHLPDPGKEPASLHWQVDSLSLVPPVTLPILDMPRKHTVFCIFYNHTIYGLLSLKMFPRIIHAIACISNSFLFNNFIYLPIFGGVAYRILVPWPGSEPVPPALETWSLNHWSTREAPVIHFFLLTNNIPLYGYILFTHTSVHAHMGCFQLLAIMNDAAMNIHVWVSVCTSFYFA